MQKAFTLIELLVVIAIISLLSAIVLPNYMGARERARDAQRKSDLRQIQKALEMYRQDNAQFPNDNFILANLNQEWISGTTVYLNKLPSDPLYSDRGYYFKKGAVSLEYQLAACLENVADADASTSSNCASVNYGYSNLGLTCPSNKCYILKSP